MDKIAELKAAHDAAGAEVQVALQKAVAAHEAYEAALAEAGLLFVVTSTDLYGDTSLENCLTLEDAQEIASAHLDGEAWPTIVKVRIQGPETDLTLTD